MARMLVRLGLVAAVVAAVGACADTSGQDLCTQYSELTAAVAGLRSLVPADAPDDVVAKAVILKNQLNRLQAVSEGRLDTAISNLRTAADDVQQAGLAAGTSAQDAAAPLLTDAVDEVKVAFEALQQSLDTQCAAG